MNFYNASTTDQSNCNEFTQRIHKVNTLEKFKWLARVEIFQFILKIFQTIVNFHKIITDKMT